MKPDRQDMPECEDYRHGQYGHTEMPGHRWWDPELFTPNQIADEPIYLSGWKSGSSMVYEEDLYDSHGLNFQRPQKP